MRLNGRYRIVDLLGRGGTAAVLLVEDEAREGELLAAKLLAPERDSELLRWEFAQLRGLSHPNLARAHDLETVTRVEGEGEPEVVPGALLLTEELAPGRPADEVAERLEPAARERFVVEVAGALCRALCYLHGRGLVHRDVKPANLIVGDRPAEARLVDLALASPARPAAGSVAGSVAFMAPEALAGVASPRADLFSLGATVHLLLAGRHPFGDPDDVAATVRAILGGRAADLAEAAPGTSPGLVALVRALLGPEPADRPPGAHAVLIELARLFGPELVGLDGGATGVADLGASGPGVGLGLRGASVLGRATELARLEALVAARLDPLGVSSPVLLVLGPAGVGKSALVRDLGQRLQLRAAAAGSPTPSVVSGPLARVVRALLGQAGEAAGPAPLASAWLGEAGAGRADSTPERAALCEELAAVALAAARLRPTVVHLQEADRGLGADLVAYLHGLAQTGWLGAELGAPLAVVVELRDRPARLAPEPEAVELGPLSDEGLAEIVRDRLGREPPAALSRAALAAAHGRPALLEAFLLRALALGPPESLDARALASLAPGPDGASALASAVATLAPELREALFALSLLGAPASPAEVAELLELEPAEATERLGALWRDRWVSRDEAGRCEATSAGLAGLAAEAFEPAAARALHRRALAIVERRSPSDLPARARHAVAAGLAGAGALALSAGEALFAAGDPESAAAHLAEAARLSSGAEAARAGRLLRRALVAAGRYAEAARLCELAAARREPAARVELARTLRLAGDLEGARRHASRATRSKPTATAARAVLARLALDGGEAKAALEAARDPEPGEASGPGAAELEEVAGLARLALGEEDRAEAHFEACLALRRAEGEPAGLARAYGLLGMVAHHRGLWPEAAARYGEAVSLARAAGHAHAAAAYSVNLASCRLETGELGAALEPLRRAAATFSGLGRDGELAGALHNYGCLLLALSDPEGASRVHERALGAARRAGARLAEGYCELLGGDILRRRGLAPGAAEAYSRALERFGELSAPRELALARLQLAEARVEAGQLSAGSAELERAAAEPARSPELRVRLALTTARLALAGIGDPRAAARQLGEARPAIERAGRRDLLWRADLLAARLALGSGARREAEALGRAASEGAAAVEASVPEHYRPGLAAEPDRAELRRLAAELAGAAPAPRPGSPADDPAVLRRLLAINKRLNSELRLGRLLDEIIDTVVELTDAERGFVLLREADGSLRPRSARNIDRTSLAGPDLSLSRSIAERAVDSGAPVLTVDAQADGRFGAASSVHALRLRSILAVPLRVKGQVVGAIYLDDRLRPAAFADEALLLVQHVADQAAIAIENARLLAENRRRSREVEGLNRELQRELDRRKVELAELRRELEVHRAGLETKYSYEAIVSRSSAMASVFRVLDRVTDSEVPVVIQGESGTGKELVARAIHFNGPRRGRAFVCENCGAIPETLLESALFGHVRGAFTGADRSRPGLFEEASGGTLLLDEVSETSPAMQAKLLRVLQEGEVRPVGGERTVRVDVRVVASSNRDLGELVRRGAFREDLYYRLNVITVRLPPLRERPEDVPPLVAHFLRKHGGGAELAVDRAALRRLSAYGWPGNVRQLENEVMRAAVLADDVVREEHLSPEIRESSPQAGRRADDLELRGRVDDLERVLIGRALVRFQGNQSRAAEALGLSRFGLQKKLRRLGIDPRTGP